MNHHTILAGKGAVEGPHLDYLRDIFVCIEHVALPELNLDRRLQELLRERLHFTRPARESARRCNIMTNAWGQQNALNAMQCGGIRTKWR